MAAAVTAALLLVAACSSGGPGPGGGLQQITAVNLNTDGASPGGANSAAVADAADAFLATLDPSQRSTVQLPFTDNQSRQTWSNYPSTQVPRKGIALSALSVPQRDALTRLLATALSPAGATQNTEIQQADDYLHGLGGQGAEGFGSLVDYFVAVYGTPSPTEPFAVQFGGHHLARNLTYHGDEVSQTPQFVGTEPTTFSVDGRTITPVGPEADAMFRVVSGLTPEQRTGAELSGTFDDLLVGPGKDTGVFPAPEGLPVTQLGPAQQQAVMAAIQAYAGDLETTAADRLVAKYRDELGLTRVGWSNNTGPTDENSYVRIDGPSVWIEFINTRSPSTPNIHYHSVYRDKTDDYGSSTPR